MADEAHPTTPTDRRVAIARLAIGLAQGVALYGLNYASTHKVWPATQPPLFGAALLALLFAPLVVIGGLGRIRAAPLAVWTVIAAAAVAWFGWHDLSAGIWSPYFGTAPRLGPAFPVMVFSAAFVFVGHHLVGPADEARKPLAPYPLYFDWAWKDGVQVALSALFVGVLWAAMELGAELFRLIGIQGFGKLLEQAWFAIPVSTTAFAAAVQLTDVRVALIRGVRTVGLVLLSWLLPVMTLIALAFLAALPFTGLKALFHTGSAATTVLGASAVLIVLTSAAYQDGASPPPVVLRWAGRGASVALAALVLIAADALWLRVGEYGLSPARIEAIACAVVAAGFAAGYLIAAIRRAGPWMKPLELTNVVMARAAMLVLLLILTPLADPARLAVDDQVSRALAGKTAPDKFDFDMLRFRAGRYGTEALKQLAALKGSPANLALAQKAQGSVKSAFPGEGGSFAERLTVYPKGAALPASFTGQDWAHPPADVAATYNNPACFYGGACDAYLLDIDGDGAPVVLLGQVFGTTGNLEIYRQGPDKLWRDQGAVTITCAGGIEALRAGQFTRIPATGSDLMIAGQRVQEVRARPACPDETSAAGNAASNSASPHYSATIESAPKPPPVGR